VTPWVVGEALECIGGNGYTEDTVMPRLYRESPLNSIWEGAGNMQCLDVLRAIRKSPGTLDAFPAEAVNVADLPEPTEATARSFVEQLARALQASLLRRYGDPAVAEAFGARSGQAFGTLPASVEFRAIIDRHRPRL